MGGEFDDGEVPFADGALHLIVADPDRSGGGRRLLGAGHADGGPATGR